MIYMKKKLSEWRCHLTMLFLSFPLGQFHLQEKMIKKYFYNFSSTGDFLVFYSLISDVLLQLKKI